MRLSKVPGLRQVLRLPAWPARVCFGDVVRGLPVPEGSCRRLFCDQVLEHLSRADCDQALRECHRLLAVDGVFRLFVPDLASIARDYVSRENLSGESTHHFVETLGMGECERARGLKGLLQSWLGNSRHRWMWDEASMSRALSEAGFGSIRRVQYQDSGDAMFDALEGNHLEWRDAVLGMEVRKHAPGRH